MNLSPHFTLEELSFSQTAARNGWDNTPPPEAIENLRRLAALLEQVRALVGKPVNVTSGYRSKEVNTAIGSRETSQHRLGCAADIKVAGMTPDQVCRLVKDARLPYDQLIREFDSWTHISVSSLHTDARKQALIIDRQGTRLFA